MTLADAERKYADIIGPAPRPEPRRPVPKLKRHPTGQAAVCYRVAVRGGGATSACTAARPARDAYRQWAAGWPEELNEQPPKPRTVVLLTWKGVTQSVAAWARELGIGALSLRWRLSRGWSVERALTTGRLRPWFARRAEAERTA